MNLQEYPANALWLMRIAQGVFLSAHGWSIVPVYAGGKVEHYAMLANMPNSPRREDFQRRHATCAEIMSWCQDRTINLGVLTGEASGITVLDVDSLDAYRKILKLLPREWARTGFKQLAKAKTCHGRHLYFKYIGVGLTNAAHPVKGLDLRNAGGMVVLPFSVHESGWVYEWERPWSDVFPYDLPEMPEALKAWVLSTFGDGPDPTGASWYGDIEDDYDDEDDDWEDPDWFDYDDDDEIGDADEISAAEPDQSEDVEF